MIQRNADGTFQRGVTPNPLGRGARKRQTEAERQKIVAGLLACLGRAPNESDLTAAQTIAAMQIEAERLEASGRSSLEQRRIIAQLLRQSGFRPAPAAPAAKVDPMAAIKAYAEATP